MTDIEFLNHGEALLAGLEAVCDRLNDITEADIDNQRMGSMLTLTFPNHSQIIVNLQKPLHEVWMAARSGGYHYHYVDRKWIDTKSGVEFYSQLSSSASEQGGESLRFTGEHD
jgi:CyaY protein